MVFGKSRHLQLDDVKVPHIMDDADCTETYKKFKKIRLLEKIFLDRHE
jgi:hypothetical protein